MKNKRSFIILIILLFFQGIFTNVHHPLMPSYVSKLNLPDYMFGFFFAFMNLGVMIGSPIWGNLADSGKKKISVVSGFFIYGIFQFLFGQGNIFGPWTLSLIRFLSGFGMAASFTIIMSEIIILSENKNKARNIALATAALAIGGAFGQFFGGQMYTNPFFINIFKTDQVANVLLVQGILSFILGFYVILFFKPKEVLKDKTAKRVSFFEGFKRIKELSPKLIIFLFAIVFITMAQTNVDKYLDVYFINDLGYKENILGQFKMIVGFVSVLTSIFIVPLFMKIRNRLFLISLFQVISATLIFIIFTGTAFSFLTYLYSFYLIYIMVKTTNEPLDREYVSSFAENENMGVVTGIRQSFFSLGTIIGPILGAFLYDYNSKLVFYVSIIFFLFSIVLIWLSSLVGKEEKVIPALE